MSCSSYGLPKIGRLMHLQFAESEPTYAYFHAARILTGF
jgi:hypothetical protein